MSKGGHTVMRISTGNQFIADALKSLKRNKSISIASVATVAATLFIVGVFLLLFLNVKQGIVGVESKIEVKVFLTKNITVKEQNELQDAIKNLDGVKEVNFENKYQALDNLKEQLGEENKDILEGLDDTNPMPDSYIIKVKTPEDVTTVVEKVQDMNGVESIQDGREIINKLIIVTKSIKWVGAAIFIILAAVSIFLIGNTIKITVYSRKREIGIMKYIGATDWFIRWPFILEGMIIGLVGSLISIVILYYAYKFTYGWAVDSFVFAKLIKPSYVLTSMIWEFIIGGIVIGAVGSMTAIRKFLAV